MTKPVEKLFSARFIMTISFSITTCYGFIKGLINTDAFIPLVALIINWYFDREDRGGTDDTKANPS